MSCLLQDFFFWPLDQPLWCCRIPAEMKLGRDGRLGSCLSYTTSRCILDPVGRQSTFRILQLSILNALISLPEGKSFLWPGNQESDLDFKTVFSWAWIISLTSVSAIILCHRNYLEVITLFCPHLSFWQTSRGSWWKVPAPFPLWLSMTHYTKYQYTEVEGCFHNLLGFNHSFNYLEKVVWEFWTP